MGIPAPLGLAASGLPNAGDMANAVVSGIIIAVGPQPPFAFRGPLNLAIYASINTRLTTTTGSLAATVASATGLAAGDAINSVNLPGGSTIGAIAGTAVTLALTPRTHYGTIGSTGQLTGPFPTDRVIGATVTTESNNEGVTLPANTTVTAVLQAYIPATPNSPQQLGIVQLSANPTITLPAFNNQIPFLFTLTGNGVQNTGPDATALFTGANITYSGSVQIERSFDGGKTWIVCNVGGGGTLAIYAAGTPISNCFGEPEKNVLYRLNCTSYVSGVINYRMSQTGGAAESLAIGPLVGG